MKIYDDEEEDDEDDEGDDDEEEDGDDELPDVILLVQCNQCLSLSQLLAAPENKIDVEQHCLEESS